MNTLSAALTEQEMNTLDDLLLPLAERLDEESGEDNNCILSLTELDGYLTAIVCAPDVQMPSHWLPAIWGGVMPVFESEQEANQVINLIMRHMNNIATSLRPDPSLFNPVFGYRDIDGVEYEIVDDWCHGFMRAVLNDIDAWQTDLDDPQGPMLPILLFGTEKGREMLKNMDDDEVTFFREQTVKSVQQLIINAAPVVMPGAPGSRTPARNDNKTGRNAPCPCGSGKKFKHCCLQ